MSLPDLNAMSLPELFESLTGPVSPGGGVDRLLDAAFMEDLGMAGDITSRSIIPADRVGEGSIVARSAGVVAGFALVERIANRFERCEVCGVTAADGDLCQAGETLARLRMPLRDLLALERTMLNLLGRLSGIATMTKQYVEAIAGTRAVICDTRKTTPGLRAMEKYAVRCGGGTLHRLGLHDAALFKDNHLAHIPVDRLAEELRNAAKAVREKHDVRFVEVEVDTLEQFREVLSIDAGLIDIVLLDNMTPDALRAAVALRNSMASPMLLEASGGVSLQSVRAVAETGVDRISVGAITHGAPWLDLALDVAG